MRGGNGNGKDASSDAVSDCLAGVAWPRASWPIEWLAHLPPRPTPKIMQGTTPTPDGAAEGVRLINLRPRQPNACEIQETNRVVTSKYNIVTFLPVFLFEMFSRVAYLYFLIQAGLSWWSVVSPYSGLGATAALLFVLGVAAVKAAFEDRKRHQEDKRMNTSVTHLLQPDGSVVDVSWTDVRVGDLVVVRDDELFPADLLCLHSALPDRVCFIRTTNLDGETNLKIRRPLDARGVYAASVAECAELDVDLRAELPNKNLHRFKGSATVRAEALRDAAPLSPGLAGAGASFRAFPEGETPSVEVPVTINEMLLRGCMLKNSGCVVGLAVYTGRQTRIQMNAAKTPLKVGSFDRFLNLQITLIIAMQLAMCVFLAVANQVWVERTGRQHYYLALNDFTEGVYESAVLQVAINFLTFWILLSYLVPISLFVTMEIVKFWQGVSAADARPLSLSPLGSSSTLSPHPTSNQASSSSTWTRT
jgi:phospholipid-transporting ATPase